MMDNTFILNTIDENSVITLSGDVTLIFDNSRATRFMKDCTEYQLFENEIHFSVADDFSKTVDRIKRIVHLAGGSITFNRDISTAIDQYLQNEKEFQVFSKKALDIRNNHCNISEFAEFIDSLKTNMTNRSLYQLQALSAYHLAFSQNSCNFSVPGAGKTSVVYGAYAYLSRLPEDNYKKVDKLLIIGPLSSFSPWEMEYEECFGKIASSKRLSGKLDEKKQYLYSNNPSEITLVSYASASALTDELRYFLEKNRTMVVLDEAHKIKNTSGGKTAQAVLDIAPKCKARVVLTGTPAPNGYEDLANLFKFIWPEKDIIKYQIGQLLDMSRTANDRRVDSLINSISPYFVRIKKSDLGIPPATNHPPINVDMKPSQRRIYEFIEKKYMSEIAGNRDQSFRSELVRARLVRLMQAATNPDLLKLPLSAFSAVEGVDFSMVEEDTQMINEISQYSQNEIPAKFEAAKNLILTILKNNGKVIVWACYIKTIESLQRYFFDQGIESRILYGATPIASDGMSEDDDDYELTRESIIKQFHLQGSAFRVIIANPFAVSESISLHKACHNAIYLERSFNAAHFIQSKDRIHRYGLKEGEQTNYYFLVSADSVDEVIHERLLKKERRLMEIIENAPIPLFDNASLDGGDEDIKAVLNAYARRTKTL